MMMGDPPEEDASQIELLHATIQHLREACSKGEAERNSLLDSLKKASLRTTVPVGSAGAPRGNHYRDPSLSALATADVAGRPATQQFLKRGTDRQAWKYHFRVGTADGQPGVASAATDNYVKSLELDNKKLRSEIDALHKDAVKRDAEHTHAVHVLQNRVSTAETNFRGAASKLLIAESELDALKRKHDAALHALARAESSKYFREGSFKKGPSQPRGFG